MPSMAFVADQSAGAKVIHNNQRSEMVALALPAGNYALFASGTVEGSDSRSVHCFIETTSTTVATSDAQLEVKPVFVPVPALFGVLTLASWPSPSTRSPEPSLLALQLDELGLEFSSFDVACHVTLGLGVNNGNNGDDTYAFNRSVSEADEAHSKQSKLDYRLTLSHRARAPDGRLLLPARLSGVSIHHRLALGGLGRFSADIRRRGVRCRRLDHGLLDIDHATRPAEIVGPSARRGDSFTRVQPNGRPRTFAGSS
jgi:hypothetical protein